MDAKALVGTVLGTCTLQKLIGQGGMGAVYLAQQSRPRRQVAVKVLLPTISLNSTMFLERFRREADAVASLEHPNIIPIYEYNEQRGLAYLVMPYIKGGSLHDQLERERRLPLDKIANYLDQVATAIDVAHKHGVIHRDIKPANILMTSDGHLFLADFGLMKIIAGSRSLQSPLTDPMVLIGTPDYMAPEQAFGEEVDPRTDVYSLGLVLYQMVAGTTPFRGSPMQILNQHLQFPPPSPKTLRPDLPLAAEQVILRALAKHPEDRYSHAQDLANAFRMALVATDIAPTNPNPPDGQKSPTKLSTSSKPPMFSTPFFSISKPWQKASILLALILIVGGIIFAMYPFMHSQQSQPVAAHNQNSLVTASTTDYNTDVTHNGIMFGFDTAHTHFNPYERIISTNNVAQLALKWVGTTGNVINSSPVVANGIIYVGSRDNKLYAFDASTGQLKWTALTGGWTDSSPSVAYGVVYVGSWNGRVYTFDAITGQQEWTFPTGSSIDSSPTVANEVVYVGSRDHRLYAFDPFTGQQKWTFPAGSSIDSSPAVANGVVYVGSQDHKLYALDASTGQLKWYFLTGGAIDSSPAVANGVIYVGSQDGKLYAFDASTGQLKWASPTGNFIDSSPAIANGTVYVGSLDHKLYAFDASTGRQKWTFTSVSEISSSPTVANGIVYVGSWDHKLYALDASTGQQRWAFATGDSIESSPVVANGMVYVGSQDGNLYAFHVASTQ